MSPLLVPFAADWSEAFFESRESLTGVAVSEAGTEQRRLLRRLPKITYRFTITAETPELAGLLQRIKLLADGDTVAAPAWPYVTDLLADAAASTSTLQVDTTYPPWVRYAMVYQVDGVAELVEIASIGVNTLNLVDPLENSWLEGVHVVPCFSAVVEPNSTLDWHARYILRWTPEFHLDPLEVEAMTGAIGGAVVNMTLGVSPDRIERNQIPILRSIRRFEDPITGRRIDTLPYVARTQPDYAAVLYDEALVTEFWDWWGGRLGRMNPSWVPTFAEDLPLSVDIAAIDTAITINNVGYAQLFAMDRSRRHLAFIDGISQYTVREVESVVDNGDTETLNLIAAAGLAVDHTIGMVSFAHYCRLREDMVTVEWTGPWQGRITLPFIDLPHEAPADSEFEPPPAEPDTTPASVHILQPSINLDDGATGPLSAEVRNVEGDPLTGQTVTWDVDDEGVATAGADSGDPDHETTITAVDYGETEITAASGLLISAPAIIIVQAPSDDLYWGTDFRNGDFSGVANGFFWRAGNPTVELLPSPLPGGLSATMGIRHRHTTGNSNQEKRWHFGIPLSHFFIGFYRWMPSVFVHRDGPSSDNHKWLRLWRGEGINNGYTDYDLKFGMSTDKTDPWDGDARMRIEYGYSTAACATAGVGQRGTPFTGVCFPAGVGAWYHCLAEFQVSTAVGVDDGIIGLWIDGVEKAYHDDLDLYPRCPGVQLNVNEGYIEGAANQGWDVTTDIFTANFRIAATALAADPDNTTGYV